MFRAVSGARQGQFLGHWSRGGRRAGRGPWQIDWESIMLRRRLLTAISRLF